MVYSLLEGRTYIYLLTIHFPSVYCSFTFFMNSVHMWELLMKISWFDMWKGKGDLEFQRQFDVTERILKQEAEVGCACKQGRDFIISLVISLII